MIIAFVANDRVALQPLQERLGLGTLMALTRSQQQLQWVA